VSQTTVFCSGDSIISSIVCFGGFLITASGKQQHGQNCSSPCVHAEGPPKRPNRFVLFGF
jgi:hypothetical protein